MNAVYEFADAIGNAGLGTPEIVADGRIHRFATPEDHHGKKSGWYCLHDDQHPAGMFGSWRTGTTETWSAQRRDELTPSDRAALDFTMAAIRQQRDESIAMQRDEAAQRAGLLWTQAQPAPAEHPYLVSKHIEPHGCRVNQRGQLVIPLLNISNQIRSLQFIAPDGSKLFLAGGEKRGNFFPIGATGEQSLMYICEGFATGATIHQSTGKPVFCAMDSGNLRPVAEELHHARRNLEIVIACDDDWRTAGNPGRTKGIEAAQAVRGRYVVPDFSGLPRGEKDSDFNDLARLLRECGQ